MRIPRQIFITLLALPLIFARTNQPTTIKCDAQSKTNKSEDLCSITNRFYDFESWQVERMRSTIKLTLVDVQCESLPTGLSESFPNLLSYTTSETTFKTAKKENFRNLKRLETLELKKGMLTRIRRDAFEDLESLLRLDLSENMIKLMSAEYFREMGRLEFLTFANNEVEEIQSKTFRNLLNLKMINGDNNELIMITEGTFENNKKLRSVSFRGNNLRFINTSTFHDLEDLKSVDLRENQCIDKKYEISTKVRKFLGMLRMDVRESCQNGVKE